MLYTLNKKLFLNSAIFVKLLISSIIQLKAIELLLGELISTLGPDVFCF
jgi:hypothetical protein